MGAELPPLDTSQKEHMALVSADALIAEEVVGNQQATVEAAMPTTDQAKELINDMGGLEAHKNKYGRDVSKCPFLNSLGEAGLKMFEAMSTEAPTIENKKTVAELMAEKKQQKLNELTEAAAEQPVKKLEQLVQDEHTLVSTINKQDLINHEEIVRQSLDVLKQQQIRQKVEDLHEQLTTSEESMSIDTSTQHIHSKPEADQPAYTKSKDSIDSVEEDPIVPIKVQQLTTDYLASVQIEGKIDQQSIQNAELSEAAQSTLTTHQQETVVELHIPELSVDEGDTAGAETLNESASTTIEFMTKSAERPLKQALVANELTELLPKTVTELINPEVQQQIHDKTEHMTQVVVELLQNNTVDLLKVTEIVQQHYEQLLTVLGLHVSEQSLKAAVAELVQQLFEQAQLVDEPKVEELSIAIGTHEYKTMAMSTISHFTKVVTTYIERFINASRYILQSLRLQLPLTIQVTN